ncbi:hypothetical protein LVJ94_35940 [Pendulispora rubella]|uniref:Lipoprotein n=1 Tax=Pendulispora rubella TaxID=2741070 RepID=A0ABZ2KXN1_9BACT
MKRFLVLAGMMGTLMGCGGYTEVHEIVLRQPQPPTGRDVQLYVGNQSPPQPFYEMALLQAIGFDGDSNVEDVTEALRERGRQLGCHALVRVRVELGYAMAHGYGVCVRWATPQARPPAPISG